MASSKIKSGRETVVVARSLLPLAPRGLQRESAAQYIGVSTSKFDELVKDGRMPSPKRIDRRLVWDRHALDEAFDRLPSDGEPCGLDDNPWDAALADDHL